MSSAFASRRPRSSSVIARSRNEWGSSGRSFATFRRIGSAASCSPASRKRHAHVRNIPGSSSRSSARLEMTRTASAFALMPKK